MKRLLLCLVLLTFLFVQAACRHLNPNDLFGTKPCILITTACGPGESSIVITAEQLLAGSYGRGYVDNFVQTLPEADQARFETEVKEPDRWFDRWALKHVMDLWAQMWWRGEDDHKWQSAGYDNG